MKKFLSLCAALIALGVIAGCTTTGPRPSGEDWPIVENWDSSKEVTVNFWHAMGQDNQIIIARIIENFQKEVKEKYNMNIKVDPVPMGGYDELRDGVTYSVAAGETPTVVQTYPDHVSLYNEGNAMRELTSFIDHSKWGLSQADIDQYVEGFWNEGSIYDKEGTMFSIPFNKSTEVLYYNKTIFEKYNYAVPQTWQDIVEVSKKFAQTSEYKALIAAKKKVAGFSYDSEANLFITLTQQWGGKYTGFDANGEGEFLFDNLESKTAMQFYLDNFKAGHLMTTTYFGTNYSSDAFKAGQIIMTLGSSAGAKYNVPSDNSFEVGVTTYPQNADSDKKYVIQQGTNVSLLKCKTAEEELAGWLFIKFLTNKESALDWALNTSYFPIRKDVQQSQEYQDYILGKIEDEQGNVQYKPIPQTEAARIGLLQSDYFYTSEAFPGSAKARTEAELLVQKILYGSKSIDQAYKEALDNILFN